MGGWTLHSEGNQIIAWLTLSTEHDAHSDSSLDWAGQNWLAGGCTFKSASACMAVSEAHHAFCSTTL